MSQDQLKKLDTYINGLTTWLTRALLAANIWFLIQIYNDFQHVKDNVNEIETEISAIKTSLDIIKNYDLKPKR
jgi:hypothetical protein